MPPDILIILLILAFYALECVVWGKKRDTWFRTVGGKTWRIVRSRPSFETDRSNVIILFPLPPLGIHSPAHPPEIAFSGDGLCRYVEESEDPKPGRDPAYHAYEAMESVSARDRDVLINGHRFIQARSRTEAQELAEFIRKIKGAKAGDREALIVRRIESHFDVAGIKEKAGRFIDQTAWLSTFCNLLWFYLVLATPVVLYLYGFSKVILFALVAVLALHLTVTVLAHFKHREMSPGRGSAVLWRLLPSPFNSIRAVDLLARDLLSGRHPFAAAAALLNEERFGHVARKRLAWIRHPLYDREMPDEAQAADRWFKRRLIAAMEDTVKKKGLDLDLLGFPEHLEEAAAYAAYCPRCHALYRQDTGVCADCGDIPLVPVDHRGK